MIKISYLVATYDTASYLNTHIAGLLKHQTDPDFEIVVINHESPGADLEVAQEWAKRDERVIVLDEKDYGCYGPAWLQGWKKARGQFVCNSNVDDSHHPEFTAKFHYVMSNTSLHIAFCYAGWCVVDEVTGQIVSNGTKPEFDFDVMSRECWAGPQVCWRNDEKFRDQMDWGYLFRRATVLTSGFDYALWLYFMSLGYYGTVIPEILTYYLRREDSVENSNKWMNNWDTYVAIAEHFPHHFKNRLKHAKEFAGFPRVPQRDTWIRLMREGKKWKDSYEWQTMD